MLYVTATVFHGSANVSYAAAVAAIDAGNADPGARDRNRGIVST